MRKLLLLAILFFIIILSKSPLMAQDHQFDPPWNLPPESGVQFTVPGIDNVPDLYGDIINPELVIFFAGNQFMVIDDLMKAFKKAYPKYQRIFAETLPSGILAKQIQTGSITIGNMRIDIKPDVYTAGKSRITEMQSLFSRTEIYAYNKLAIMVPKGNPKNIQSLNDLGRSDVRLAMPNPEWEGIGKRIEEAYVKAGGETLRNTIMNVKVKDKSTYLTQIHHRQTPMRILYNLADAGPVWYSEAFFQKMIQHPVDLIEVPDQENIQATYMAGQLKNAPHTTAATDFMNFLISPVAKAIYHKYGFSTE